ncbi:hypothetical protein H9P43_006903 [Blastocladiella emersonii ATCC 22665]|nr:hypothetical protein H9P43_006903 [Blastocladiella emersonii ATCC 22665]
MSSTPSPTPPPSDGLIHPWVQSVFGIVIAVVAITTVIFVFLQLRMNLWGFYGSAQIARKEGRVGAVQTFNQGEARGRIALCIVFGVLYTAFILFVLASFLQVMLTRSSTPAWLRIPWQPISPAAMNVSFVCIYLSYASTAIVSAVATFISFCRDRVRMRSLAARKAEADAARGDGSLEAGITPAAAAASPPSYDWDKDVIILVPTYQEPLSNLLSTISAITESDYPPEKIHVLVSFDDDSEKTLTTMFTIERILNGGIVRGYNDDDPASSRLPSADYEDVDAPPAYDDLPTFKTRDKYNGLLKLAHLTRSSLDLRSRRSAVPTASSSPSRTSLASSTGDDADPNPRAIEINFAGIQFTVARYEHGGKLHTQAKMFALVEERVAAGVYSPDALLLFVDSDTTLVPSTVRKFVDHFAVHQQRACATGFIVSRNGHANSWLQKMQDAEYIFMQVSMRYVEATFGSVTCLPGALTMIKYATMHELAKIYFHQPDVDSTFEFCRRKLGEDRFLTHLAMEYLGPFSIGFVPDALSKTEAPNHFYDLMRQRRRWLLGSLTNEMFMITTPSFLTKYPALVILRLVTMMRIGGTSFLLICFDTILRAFESPHLVSSWDVLLVIGVPMMFWVVLTAWAVWQHRVKSLVFFFAYLVCNQVFEMVYYAYALWTMNQRTWGGPRAVGEGAGEDEEEAALAGEPSLFAAGEVDSVPRTTIAAA